MEGLKAHLGKILLLAVLSSRAHALVDYSEEVDFTPKNSGSEASSEAPKNKVSAKAPSAKSESRRSSSGLFSLGAYYESMEIPLEGRSGKLNTTHVKGHFQTLQNLYLDFDYRQAETKSETLNPDGQSGKGNPTLRLGFNWFDVGGNSDKAQINLIGGYSMGQSNSYFATSRNDKIVGVETVKRFEDFALGLGFDMRIVGTPKNESEMGVGNIQTLMAHLGWRATPDIAFVLEGSTTKVAASSETNRLQKLNEDVSFGQLTPKLQLGLSPLIELELGATFRTKRVKDGSLVEARLWNLTGSYGNSVFAGLLVNI